MVTIRQLAGQPAGCLRTLHARRIERPREHVDTDLFDAFSSFCLHIDRLCGSPTTTRGYLLRVVNVCSIYVITYDATHVLCTKTNLFLFYLKDKLHDEYFYAYLITRLIYTMSFFMHT